MLEFLSTLHITEEEGVDDSNSELESDISVCFRHFGRSFRVSYEELNRAWGFDPNSPLTGTADDDDDDPFDGFCD